MTITAIATLTFQGPVHEMPHGSEPHYRQVTIIPDPGDRTGTGKLYIDGVHVGSAVATRTRGEWLHSFGHHEYLVTETEIDAILEWRHEDPVPGVPFGA